MTIPRAMFLAIIASLLLTASPAAAQEDAAAGYWNGWVQWSGENAITDVTWQLNEDTTVIVHTDPREYGNWFEVGEYVEMLYPCTQGQFICHYRGRRTGNVMTGVATSNAGHTATFEMRR